jgi:hypothetical protein
VGLTTPHSKKLIVTKVEQRKKLDGFNDDGESWRQIGKLEGYCSTGQSTQWAVVPVEEEVLILVQTKQIRINTYKYVAVTSL